MGLSILDYYKNHVRKSWKIAFFSAFLATIIIHIYKFTNTLPNHDSVYNVYSNQDVTSSGRWFLSLACGVSSYFDLPWINGLMSGIYLGMTACIVAEIFEMENPVVICLSSVLLVASPCTTETFFFEYTADGYLLGLMLSAFAALLSAKGTRLYDYIISAVLLCLSCGVYQAYISFSILLCICYLIDRILDKRITVPDAWKWIGRHIPIYTAGMSAYYVIWKLIMKLTGVTASNYQGISTVGKIGLSTLINGVVNSFKNLAYWFFCGNFINTSTITLYEVLNIVFAFVLAFIVIYSVVKSQVCRIPGALGLVIFCFIACIPAVSIWSFLSNTVMYRPMMLHSVMVMFIFSIILFDKWVDSKKSTVFAAFMTVIIFNFSILANVAYFYMQKCYEKSYFVGSQMMEKIEEISQEYDVESIAFVGNRHEELYIIYNYPGSNAFPFSYMIEKDLLYDNSHAYLFLQNSFDLEIPLVSWDEKTDFENHPEVLSMETWPAFGSAKVIDNVLVIKLSN